MKTLHAFITELSNGFTTATRPNGETFIKIKDFDYNEVLTNIVREAHDGLMPNDIIFTACRTIINDLYDRLDEESENFDEYYYEDTGCEFEKYDFLTFPHFEHYCDQAINECGAVSMAGIIQGGQYHLINEVCYKIQSAIMELEDQEWQAEE